MTKRWVVIAAAVPLVLVAAVAGAAWSFDPNTQKARLVEAVQRATGRTLVVAGPVRLHWSLTPTLEANDVSLANMPGGSRPAMATAARVEARIRLWPLLSHRVELARVMLMRPDILIETDAEGRGNWRFQRPAAAEPGNASPATPGARTTTVLDSVGVTDGQITWHDGVTGRTVTAHVPRATLDGRKGPVHVLAAAQADGGAMRLDAMLGTMAQLTGQTPGPWPVRVRVALGDTTFAFDGTADSAGRGLSGHVAASVPDLAQLGLLLQAPGLLPVHDIHLDATLSGGNGVPHDVLLQIGTGDLGGVLPGLALGALSLAWPDGQPARLEANGTLAGTPWHVASGVAPAGGGVALRGLSMASAVGELTGDVALMGAPRPTLRGTLIANRLDLGAAPAPPLSGPEAPVPAASPAAGPPVVAAPAKPGRLLSDTPLPWPLLRRGDLDLQLTIGTLRVGGADYRSVAGHILLDDGVLRVENASVLAPEGQVDGSASADARQPAPPVTVALRSDAFALQPLAAAFGLPGNSDGTAELDVALHAAGATPHDLAAHLDGHVGIALVDGDVANAALAAGLGSVMRMAGAQLDANSSSHVRCLGVRANAQSGQVTLAALTLDTPRLLVEGGGTFDLANETMTLRLRPVLRLTGASVSTAIRMDGAIRQPTVAMDPSDAGRVGVVIGGASADNCATALGLARDGRPGSLPAVAAPVTGKGAKPANLLRSLLR